MLYQSIKYVIELFDEYSLIISEAKHKAKYGEGPQMLIPKKILQRLPVVLAQVKAGNTSEDLFNEIRQIIYFLYQAK